MSVLRSRLWVLQDDALHACIALRPTPPLDELLTQDTSAANLQLFVLVLIAYCFCFSSRVWLFPICGLFSVSYDSGCHCFFVVFFIS